VRVKETRRGDLGARAAARLSTTSCGSPLQLPRVHYDPLLAKDFREIGPVVPLHVLLRATVDRLIRSDHTARRFLDVLDRRHGPDVTHVLAEGTVIGNLLHPDPAEQIFQPWSFRSKKRRPSASTAS